MKYDSNGLRTRKGSIKYYYDSSNNLIGMANGNNTLLFYYDESGNPTSFSHNGTMYFYIKNLQGDICEIVDASGSVIANYTYDAWGKLLSVKDANGDCISNSIFICMDTQTKPMFGIYLINREKKMFSILEPLKGEKFDKFIAFLIEKSDSFLFHLPNFEKIMVNERNAKMMKEYPIGYSYEDDPENYNKYLQKMEKYLSIIKDDITAQYYDTGYLNQITSNEMKVFEVNISNNSPLFFSQARDFSMWMYPYLPEDPCFLYKGKCVFQTITHENLYFLYLKGKRIERFLIQNNIPFEHVPFSRRPSINRQ